MFSHFLIETIKKLFRQFKVFNKVSVSKHFHKCRCEFSIGVMLIKAVKYAVTFRDYLLSKHHLCDYSFFKIFCIDIKPYGSFPYPHHTRKTSIVEHTYIPKYILIKFARLKYMPCELYHE